VLKTLLFPLRLIGGFLMAVGVFYLHIVVWFLILLALAEVLAPLGALGVGIGAMVIVCAPYALDWLRPQASSSAHEADFAPADPAPSPPVSQAPAHVNARSEVYRGYLKAQSPE
jgi:hypothetical protein